MRALVPQVNAGTAADGFDIRYRVCEALLGALADTKRPLRRAAADSLAALGDAEWQKCFPDAEAPPDAAAVGACTRPELEEVLVNLLTVESAEDRALAARLIGQRKNNNATPGLCVAASDRDGSVRVQAVRALGELRDPTAVHAVIRAMADRSAQVRHAAVLAAGKIGDGAALLPMIGLIGDRQEQVQAAAAATLHEVQGDDALAALLPCLLGRPDSALVLRGAVASLTRWAEPAVVLGALKAAGCFSGRDGAVEGRKLASRRPQTRAAACEILGHLAWRRRGSTGEEAAAMGEPEGLAEAHATLVTMVGDKEAAVRLQAVAALGRLRRCQALGPLLPALKDANAQVVEAAISAILATDWTQFLAAGEGVALAAPVLKPMKGHGRLNAKMLIWTSRRRLVYVDAATLKLKECEPRVEAVGGASFMRVFQEGKGMRVQCVIHPPTKWEAAIGGRRSTM